MPTPPLIAWWNRRRAARAAARSASSASPAETSTIHVVRMSPGDTVLTGPPSPGSTKATLLYTVGAEPYGGPAGHPQRDWYGPYSDLLTLNTWIPRHPISASGKFLVHIDTPTTLIIPASWKETM